MFDRQSNVFTTDRAGLFESQRRHEYAGDSPELGLLRHRLLGVPAVHAADAAAGLQSTRQSAGRPPDADVDELSGQPVRSEDAFRSAAQQQRQSLVSREPIPESVGRRGAGDPRQRLDRLLAVPSGVRREPAQRNRTDDRLGQANGRRGDARCGIGMRRRISSINRARNGGGDSTRMRRPSTCLRRSPIPPEATTSCCCATSTPSRSNCRSTRTPACRSSGGRCTRHRAAGSGGVLMDPKPIRSLWGLTYDRLTNHHGLHNLIWEFTSIGVNGDEDDWYPGDDEVDIVGLDIYTQPTDHMSGQWSDAFEIYNGRKMIAAVGDRHDRQSERVDLWGHEVGLCAPWAWDYVRSEYANAGYSDAQLCAILQQFLNHEDVITLGELPVLPWNQLAPMLPGDYNDRRHGRRRRLHGLARFVRPERQRAGRGRRRRRRDWGRRLCGVETLLRRNRRGAG